MDGYNYVIISGRDGNFNNFEVNPNDIRSIKIPYLQQETFSNNMKNALSILANLSPKAFVILGWSIGAVVAMKLSTYFNDSRLILINPFFNRSRALSHLHIVPEEDVIVSDWKIKNNRILLICGLKDEKIPPTESDAIFSYLKATNDITYIKVPEMTHEISTLPKNIISRIKEFLGTPQESNLS